ncbi:MAG: flagellar hook-basal body complex protein FliE [Oscillospiraceae bacterium]|nr:flagellar hook-basal body complex protein FliE [Oscillospiraceae bacterium]
MNLTPLSSDLVNILSPTEATPLSSKYILDTDGSPDSFANILSEAFTTAGLADKADKASALELLVGNSDDLSGLLLDAQKAELSLNLALQLRNKVIDAYNEIMRMQV